MLLILDYLDQLTKGQERQIVVPDKLLENLAALRKDYVSFLREFKNILESSTSPEAQEIFVHKVDDKLSLFNITLNELCHIFGHFPAADVRYK